jgi:diguanylate cyclase (GGDEF)-like protein
MGIRLAGRHDGLLLAGLAVALLTVFDRSIAWVISLAHEVETDFGVRLVPALVVLTALVIFHQNVRRQESKAEAAAAAASARETVARIAQLERLQALSHAVAAALTIDAIRAVMWKYVPIITGERAAWVAALAGGRSDVLYDTTGMPASRIEALVLQAVEDTDREAVRGLPVRHGGWFCLPMFAGGEIVGILAVSEADSAIDSEATRLLAAASAVLGIALRNVQLFTELRETAVTDSLTGCTNRAHMLDVFAGEVRRSRRTGAELSVLMLDLDGFKDLNDRHGHVAGDTALRTIARRCREMLRQSDLRCRYGGDEFLFLLPDTPLAGAMHVAEMLRREVAALEIAHASGTERLTCSIGIATVIPGELDPVPSIHRADQALYQAKREGRNRVAVYDPAAASTKPVPVPLAQIA